MPRSGVDDVQSWAQIAPPSAVDGLTTCSTWPVAPQLVLTGLFLLFIFLMTELNFDLRRLRKQGQFRSFIVETWPDPTGRLGWRRRRCFCRTQFFCVSVWKAGHSGHRYFTLHTYHVSSRHIMSKYNITWWFADQRDKKQYWWWWWHRAHQEFYTMFSSFFFFCKVHCVFVTFHKLDFLWLFSH